MSTRMTSHLSEFISSCASYGCDRNLDAQNPAARKDVTTGLLVTRD